MRSNYNKLVLFIVEGKSDRVSLEGVVRKILKEKHSPYFIIQSDTTSDNKCYPDNIHRRMHGFINYELQKRKITLKDIDEIIHIIDLDGTYIEDEKIIEEPKMYSAMFLKNKVIVYNKERIVDRNIRKRANIEALLNVSSIAKVNYHLYYFSINLEHVLHNNPNVVSVREKIYLSNSFDDDNADNPEQFLALINYKDVKHFNNYKESWEYARNSSNALNRASNVCFALEKYAKL